MNQQQEKLLDRIVIVPGMLGGKPTIRGQRFLVSDILELLTSGLSEEEIISQHPLLEKDDIQAAVLYASNVIGENGVFASPGHMKGGIRQGETDIKNWDFLTMEEFEKRYEKYLK